MQNLSPTSFSYDYVSLLPSEQIGLHTQTTWELNHILRGKGIRVVGDTQEQFSEGEVVLVPPNVTHCWYFEAEDGNKAIKNISLQINDQWLKNLAELCPELTATIVRLRAFSSGVKFGAKAGLEIAKILLRMRKQSPQLRFASLIEILTLLTTETDGKQIGHQIASSPDEERRRNLEIYITCNYAHKITLASIARHVGLSRTSFCRWMRENMRTTFATYVIETRLGKATELLRQNPNMPISEVCYRSGFSNVPYFNRMFKLKFGLSPSSFRNNVQESETYQ